MCWTTDRSAAALALIACTVAAFSNGACSAGGDTSALRATRELGEPGAQGHTVDLELEAVYGASEVAGPAILDKILDVAVGPDGAVYVLEMDGRVVAFDSDTVVRWQVAETGQGPGALDDAGGAALRSDVPELVVLNQSGTRLDRWNVDGAYVDACRLSDARLVATELLGSIDGDVVLGRPLNGRIGYRIAIVDPEHCDLVSSWSVDLGGGLRLPSDRINLGVAAAVTGGGISFGSLTDLEVRFYTPQGELFRHVRSSDSRLVGVGLDWENQSVTTFGAVSAPVPISAGRWLFAVRHPLGVTDPSETAREWRVRGRRTLEWAREVFVIDQEGTLAGHLSLSPEQAATFGWPRYGDGSGRVYTERLEPVPQVARYKVRLVPR